MRTREEILAYADEHGLCHLPFPELELDATSGGYAFENAQGHVVVLGYDGSWGGHLLTPESPTADAVVRKWLIASRHRNRRLLLADLGVWQQAAVAAAQEGQTVAGLGLPLGPMDLDYAEFLRIHLGRSPVDPLRALAAEDFLLQPPEARRYTHPCPLCGSPALHQERYPRSVCDACYSRTMDSAGRLVTGSNTHISGGFVAHFARTSDICAEVTATKRCWVGGRACRMDEAHFGGVVVEAL